MTSQISAPRLSWRHLYSETELYKTAVRFYNKPVFSPSKALFQSTDNKTFYDFARNSLGHLNQIHNELAREKFVYRPGMAVRHNFKGKKRTFYIYPWEERLVDLLLFRMLNFKLNQWFSKSSYAYRGQGSGLDLCQRKVSRTLLKSREKSVYVLKRDISNYFGSVSHDILQQQIAELVEPRDYLYRLLADRVKFKFVEAGLVNEAAVGIPFGTAIACLFANIYLREMDSKMSRVRGLEYFRYSDDLLAVSAEPGPALEAEQIFSDSIAELRLLSKKRQERNILFTLEPAAFPRFERADRFRHLGLEFRASGVTGLSRDKCRKICNLFRYALRRKQQKSRRVKDLFKRAAIAVETVRVTLDRGIRNVALIDYYLKHTRDESQLKLMDRWIAEQVLHFAFGGGHKKKYFKIIGFKKLREMGLPSLVHRRRLLLHRKISSSFFVWKNNGGSSRRTVRTASLTDRASFSSSPEAAVSKTGG